jgi:hypothetical protein
MRLEFLKLATGWGVWHGLPTADFLFPFSRNVAALLLDRGVILTTDDVKALRFDYGQDRQVVRAALKVVVAHAITFIDPTGDIDRKWLPHQANSTTGVIRRWWLTYEIDFRIWDYARQLHQGGAEANDDGLTRWKAAYGQVARVKP